MEDYTTYCVDRRLEYTNIVRRPKLGLQYLCSVLKENNIPCEIMDQSISWFSPEALVSKVKSQNFILVGFYSYSYIKEKLIKYIKYLRRECSTKLVVGGPGCVDAQEYINSGCDIVCHKEGEKTILQIVKYVKGEILIKDIKGISYRKNRAIICNKPQDIIRNLDEIPFPDRDEIPLSSYYDYCIPGIQTPYTTMITSRGCPFNCPFCYSPVMWSNEYRLRSVRNVFEEIDYLIEKYKVKYIAFQDDVFGWDQNWLREFCNNLIKKNYDLRWMCSFHPLSFKSNRKEFVDLLERAKCNLICMNSYSTNSEILRGVNRDPDEPLAMREIIHLAKKKGILTVVETVLGLPGETKKTILENIEYSFKVKPHLVEYHSLQLRPEMKIDRGYKDKELCELSREEIDELCFKANRRFYANPKNLFQIFTYILRKNPHWFTKMPNFFSALPGTIGLRR